MRVAAAAAAAAAAAVVVVVVMATGPGAAASHVPASDPVGPGDGGSAILVLGDSLCVGARQHEDGLAVRLAAAGWDPDLRCRSGEPLAWGLAEVGSMEAVPPVVVVALGTNPRAEEPGFGARLADLRAALVSRGARRLVWVDYADRAGTYRAKSERLQLFAGHHGDEVVRWSEAVAGHPEWFRSDGLHYRPEGVVAWSEAIADVVATPGTDPVLRAAVARLSRAVAEGLHAVGTDPSPEGPLRRPVR